ncbi:lysosomal thioesterase PPT2, partial [Terrapene carolina triunguis]|uniref:lysosomal thioesterase PPT2 n=1 Tax=Terrapene triunguis TaxID=2587831 RepID=UPI0011566D85
MLSMGGFVSWGECQETPIPCQRRGENPGVLVPSPHFPLRALNTSESQSEEVSDVVWTPVPLCDPGPSRRQRSLAGCEDPAVKAAAVLVRPEQPAPRSPARRDPPALRWDSRTMGRPQRNWGVLAPLCLLLLLLLTLGASYKPVVVVHGLFDSPSVFSQLLRFINQVSPDAW